MTEYEDENLCKFLSSWNSNEKFELESSASGLDQDYISMMAVDGDKSHYRMDSEYAMEVISIGGTTYTKAGVTWWKQTAQKTEETRPVPSKEDYSFEEPSEDSEETDQIKYVKVGEGACGVLSSFKYQVVDPSDSETTEYILFDDKEFFIRKMVTESREYKTNQYSAMKAYRLKSLLSLKNLA